MAGAGHQPDATAHDDAMAPAQQRLGVGVDEEVESMVEENTIGKFAEVRTTYADSDHRKQYILQSVWYTFR